MVIERVLNIEFGKKGQCKAHVGKGWSLAEDGYRWMVDAVSELNIGSFAAGDDLLLVMDLEPFIHPPELPHQGMTISIGGVPFIQTELSAAGRYGYRVPPELVPAGDIVLVFDHSDADRPSDFSHTKDRRALAISVSQAQIFRISGAVDTTVVRGEGGITLAEFEQRVGKAADEFIGGFESLGDNCEFGLMQRRCGSEPLSLLRFANTLLPNLLNGLEDGFFGLGEVEDLGFRLEGRSKAEYIIEEKRYGLVYHTFRYKGEIDEAKFIESEGARLKFLVRKFAEDLRRGEKIFVCKRNLPLSQEEVIPVLAALNLYGGNCLLWIVPADREHPPGSVHWVIPGLLKGYIDRFAPMDNAHDLSLEVWLELCANAWEIRKDPSKAT